MCTCLLGLGGICPWGPQPPTGPHKGTPQGLREVSSKAQGQELGLEHNFEALDFFFFFLSPLQTMKPICAVKAWMGVSTLRTGHSPVCSLFHIPLPQLLHPSFEKDKPTFCSSREKSFLRASDYELRSGERPKELRKFPKPQEVRTAWHIFVTAVRACVCRRTLGNSSHQDENLSGSEAIPRRTLQIWALCFKSERQFNLCSTSQFSDDCGGKKSALTDTQPHAYLTHSQSADLFFNILKMRTITGATDSSTNTFS